MTKTELYELINSAIQPNDQKGITALTLRNVLKEMVYSCSGEGGNSGNINLEDYATKMWVGQNYMPITTFKTINGQSITGTGDIQIQSGTSGIVTETDPIFKASPAYLISTDDINNWNKKTSNVGTITGIKMNGAYKGTSGVVDLGTVVTSIPSEYVTETKLNNKGYLNTTTADSRYASKNTETRIQELQNQFDNLTSTGGEPNVQVDWNVTDTTSDAYIKNKPNIPAEVTASTVSGWGFTKNTGTYVKPSTGIPKTDLASSVQTSLNKADTALQSYTEQYKGTVTGVKINGNTKNPSSGIVDLGTVVTSLDGYAKKTDIPSLDNYVTIETFNDSKIKVENHSNITALLISPNVLYRITTEPNLTIALNPGELGDVSRHYMLELIIGDTIPNVTFPSGIKWLNGNNIIEDLIPNSICQISIFDNLAVGGVFV